MFKISKEIFPAIFLLLLCSCASSYNPELESATEAVKKYDLLCGKNLQKAEKLNLSEALELVCHGAEKSIESRHIQAAAVINSWSEISAGTAGVRAVKAWLTRNPDMKKRISSWHKKGEISRLEAEMLLHRAGELENWLIKALAKTACQEAFLDRLSANCPGMKAAAKADKLAVLDDVSLPGVETVAVAALGNYAQSDPSDVIKRVRCAYIKFACAGELLAALERNCSAREKLFPGKADKVQRFYNDMCRTEITVKRYALAGERQSAAYILCDLAGIKELSDKELRRLNDLVRSARSRKR